MHGILPRLFARIWPVEKRKRIEEWVLLVFLYLLFVSLPSLSGFPFSEQVSLRFGFRLAFAFLLIVFLSPKWGKPGRFAFRYLPFFILLPISNWLVVAVSGKLGAFHFEYQDGLRLVDLLLTVFLEETIFRAIPLSSLKDEKTKIAWIFVSSLVFALCHLAQGSWTQGVYCFGLGLALASLYVYGGGIWFSALLHFLFNFFNNEVYGWFEGGGSLRLFYLVNILVGAIFALYYLALLLIRLKRAKSSRRCNHR